ncbi:MAG TPA: hypothetical protein VIR79_00490 [Nitrospira sp.]
MGRGRTMLAGFERCGMLLAQACSARPGDNPNELPDTVIDES